MGRGSLFLAALLLGRAASPLPATAQGSAQNADSVTDMVIAVVGNTAILRTEVTEEVFSAESQGMKLPTDSAGMKVVRRQFLDSLIRQELIYQEALRDTTVQVTEHEVSDAADKTIANIRAKFKTQQEFLAELKQAGFQTPDEWRRWLLEKQRRQLTITRFRDRLREQGKLKPMSPTEKEMKAFYTSNVNLLDSLPPTISVKQIIVRPEANDSAKARARRMVDSLIVELRKGADFATAARRFSMDSVSREAGGSLGFIRRGPPLDNDFERAAFALKPGTISEPVQSAFGLHVIQVQRIQGPEIDVSHILIMPDVDSISQREAHARADSIVAWIGRGAAFDSLQRLYADPIEQKNIEGVPISALPPEYSSALASVDSGKVSRVFELPVAGQAVRSKWAIILVTGRTAAGPSSYARVRENIRTLLARQLGEEAYVKELRAKTYIDIREP